MTTLPSDAPPSPEAVPATTELREVLDKKRMKGLQWEEASLDDALMYLRTVTGVNFMVSPEARAKAGADAAITMKLDDVPVSTVLDLVAEQLGLHWEERDGVVWVVAP